MIVQFILTSFLWLLTAIFSVFSLPAMPLVIVQAINAVIGFFGIPIGLLRNFVGDNFLLPVLAILVIYVFFNPIWYITVWIYQRIKS